MSPFKIQKAPPKISMSPQLLSHSAGLRHMFYTKRTDLNTKYHLTMTIMGTGLSNKPMNYLAHADYSHNTVYPFDVTVKPQACPTAGATDKTTQEQ